MSELIIRKENQVCNYALTGWIVVAEETESVQCEPTYQKTREEKEEESE